MCRARCQVRRASSLIGFGEHWPDCRLAADRGTTSQTETQTHTTDRQGGWNFNWWPQALSRPTNCTPFSLRPSAWDRAAKASAGCAIAPRFLHLYSHLFAIRTSVAIRVKSRTWSKCPPLSQFSNNQFQNVQRDEGPLQRRYVHCTYVFERGYR